MILRLKAVEFPDNDAYRKSNLTYEIFIIRFCLRAELEGGRTFQGTPATESSEYVLLLIDH